MILHDRENMRMRRDGGHCAQIAGECMAKAEQVLENGAEKEEIRALARELDRLADSAIAGGEPELKLRLLRKKEQLLERLYETSE